MIKIIDKEMEEEGFEKIKRKPLLGKKYSRRAKISYLTTDDLAREVAKRASFTVGDVSLILQTVREVLVEWIVERKPFHWFRLFKIAFVNFRGHTSYSPLSESPIERPERTSVFVRVSPYLKQTVKKLEKNKN